VLQSPGDHGCVQQEGALVAAGPQDLGHAEEQEGGEVEVERSNEPGERKASGKHDQGVELLVAELAMNIDMKSDEETAGEEA